MSNTRMRCVILSLFVALLAVSLGAQTAISTGTYQGSLGASSTTFDGYRGREYTLRAQAGVQYQIDVMSSDFDAYVVVFHPDGSRYFNDDGGAGLNARLVTTPNTSGTMRIIARSFSRTPSGNYTLQVQATGQSGSMSVRNVGTGTHFGTLGAGSGEFEGYRADEYRVNVSGGRSYQIDVISSDFDAYVVVFHPDGSRYVNDDGGEGLNARLVTTPNTSGIMRVIARSFSRTPSGTYTVLVNEASQVSFGTQSISLGTIFGNLTMASPRFDGYRGQEFHLQVSANTTYQIDVISSDFDAYVVVFHPDGSRHFNDDGGDGLNARLVTTPRTGGTMRIIARSFRQDATGQYRLETQRR
ncbi:MAG: hypothetical protein EA383_17280 [Spirochaetaceae bacterium]|nr:MAG: hypothetical protein EA383_17280 [Spirochaetaceae bacterium]